MRAPSRRPRISTPASESGEAGLLKKRSITLLGHPTSVALEPEFWRALEAMAEAERCNLTAVLGRIDAQRAGRPLASACRVAALHWTQAQEGSARSAAEIPPDVQHSERRAGPE